MQSGVWIRWHGLKKCEKWRRGGTKHRRQGKKGEKKKSALRTERSKGCLVVKRNQTGGDWLKCKAKKRQGQPGSLDRRFRQRGGKGLSPGSFPRRISQDQENLEVAENW